MGSDSGQSKVVVYVAVAAHFVIMLAKFAAAAVTGSSALLSEGIHSTADTSIQGLPLFGKKRSNKAPDEQHPLGYGQELYFCGLIVTIVLFGIGGGKIVGASARPKQARLGLAGAARPALLVATLVLAACGHNPPPVVPAPEPPSAPEPRAEPGDTLIGRPTPAPPEREPEPQPEPAPTPEPTPEPTSEARPPTPAHLESGFRARGGPAEYRAGAVLPASRVVAFYGNPLSTRLGILGALPPERMLARLDRIVEEWSAADPGTPVRAALEPIVVQAASAPGPERLHRVRMSDAVIGKVVDWAATRNALVVLDVQQGRSSVQDELPRLVQWLKRPEVHLALDPEWAMAPNQVPGKVIGTLDASDINYAVDLLADLVDRYDLPPKILVVHRFTEGMVTHVDEIRTDDPRVQVVLLMDGWGPATLKRSTYRSVVAPAEIPFTGFKLFFTNDTRAGSRLMTPEQVLRLTPPPFFIQYQ